MSDEHTLERNLLVERQNFILFMYLPCLMVSGTWFLLSNTLDRNILLNFVQLLFTCIFHIHLEMFHDVWWTHTGEKPCWTTVITVYRFSVFIILETFHDVRLFWHTEEKRFIRLPVHIDLYQQMERYLFSQCECPWNILKQISLPSEILLLYWNLVDVYYKIQYSSVIGRTR